MALAGQWNSSFPPQHIELIARTPNGPDVVIKQYREPLQFLPRIPSFPLQSVAPNAPLHFARQSNAPPIDLTRSDGYSVPTNPYTLPRDSQAGPSHATSRSERRPPEFPPGYQANKSQRNAVNAVHGAHRNAINAARGLENNRSFTAINSASRNQISDISHQILGPNAPAHQGRTQEIQSMGSASAHPHLHPVHLLSTNQVSGVSGPLTLPAPAPPHTEQHTGTEDRTVQGQGETHVLESSSHSPAGETPEEDPSDLQSDAGHSVDSEFEEYAGEFQMLKRDRSALPTEVNRVLDAIKNNYSGDRGKHPRRPVRIAIYNELKKLKIHGHFGPRGDLLGGSSLRNYTLEQLGMTPQLWDHIDYKFGAGKVGKEMSTPGAGKVSRRVQTRKAPYTGRRARGHNILKDEDEDEEEEYEAVSVSDKPSKRMRKAIGEERYGWGPFSRNVPLRGATTQPAEQEMNGEVVEAT